MSTFFFHLETLYLQFAGYFISNYFEFRERNNNRYTYKLNFISYLDNFEYEVKGEITINYLESKVEQLYVSIYSGLYMNLKGDGGKAKEKAINIINDFLFNADESELTKITYNDYD